ncbi:hypothetical protein H0H92_005264, partial [Tricholoma furcatifolium]
GSMTDSYYLLQCKMRARHSSQVEKPIMLQLGMIGSRSIVNYGAIVAMEGYGVGKMYVDIANFDKYNCIIGTLFMHANKVKLDFENMKVIVNGVTIKATPVVIENDGRLQRYQTAEKKVQGESK